MPTVLPDLPVAADRRVAVRVTPDALRQIRSGHPWVYDRSVVSHSHDAPPGDLAVVFDSARRFAAIGLWDPTSPIRVRILHRGTPATIDADFFAAALTVALARRAGLVEDASTTGYRIVNGESDGFPGLVVDRYADTLVVKLYTAAWVPHLATLVGVLIAGVDPARIVVRMSRTLQQQVTGLVDGETVWGPAPAGPVAFLERGIEFGADVVRGHKTGHFLDQRDNRVLVGTLAAGRTVLDVFASTGGFSVHAAAGGATEVDSVDISAPALAAARANMARNADAVRACRHRTTTGDAFEVLTDAVARGRTWDVVVIDPPSFAPRQESVGAALRAYARLTELGLAVTRDRGTFVQSSCSARIGADEFHRQIDLVSGRAGVELHDIARTDHPVDHPATIPEARYLKTRVARVVR